MNTNDKTLADVQPGGRVRLKQSLPPEGYAGAWIRSAYGQPSSFTYWNMEVAYAAGWQAALSAQPSPGDQDASFPWENFPAYLIDKCEGDTISEEGLQQALAAMAKDERYCLAARQPVESEENVAADTYWTLAEMIEPHVQREGINPDGALPASVHDSVAILLGHWLHTRQPVEEPIGYLIDSDNPEIGRYFNEYPTTRAERCRPIYDGNGEVYAAPPAQAVDLPYSLDADPAGIRARVCDVITGTLMVGAQGHTPPPAGHWAEPFWKAARADAIAQAVDLGRARASIQSLLNWIDDWAETPEESGIDAIEAEAEAVLALIDKAVGK